MAGKSVYPTLKYKECEGKEPMFNSHANINEDKIRPKIQSLEMRKKIEKTDIILCKSGLYNSRHHKKKNEPESCK